MLKAERPKSEAYPDELVTYGDHIRARRLDAGMSQREAAEAMGVDETSVFNWESNRVQPAVRLIPGIIRFLGYCPYTPGPSFSNWLKLTRHSLGYSQSKLAGRLGIDEGTWGRWEAGKIQPASKYLRRIRSYLDSP
jgi:transcriptional regulator with XRE-family HTH domain